MKLSVGAVLLLFAMLLTGCDVTKPISDKDHLLIKNKFQINTRKVTGEELSGYLQQQPNTKLFGLFRASIAFYNMGSKGKETKFKKWLRTKPGSPPVLLDTGLVNVGMKQMRLYLANKGYFNSQIDDSIVFRKKKAIVYYKIKTTEPYTVRRFLYSIPDTQTASHVYKDTAKCLIRPGHNYDAYLLDDERGRITTNLLNYGFLRFSKNFIVYHIDSSLNNHKLDITLEITNPVVPSFDDFTTVVQANHKRYYIDKILIYPESDHLQADTGRYDTLVKTYENPAKGIPSSTYYFLYRGKFKVKPRTITQAIFITPGSYYNLADVTRSYSQISSLQVFNYINIQFKDTPGRIDLKTPFTDVVDCKIQLSRAPVQSFSITTDGTNSGGAFGVQANLGYQNKNIFRGAQSFRANVSIAAQMQASGGPENDSKAFFNTIDLGANAGITFPQFLLPIKPEKLPKHFKPKTTISIGYNYQHQQDYNRHISNISFGYTWYQNERMTHVLNPAEITLVKIYPDSLFNIWLNSQVDKRLKNQYTDHLVAGLKYTLNYSSQQIGKVKDFFYIRTNFETGGNLIYGINSIFKPRKNENGQYTLFGLPYSQYVRPDVDFRYYNMFANKFSMVYRFYGGIGIPYGNSSVLPFEKAFFSGGANGMRGWKMYYLGPGSYHNDTTGGSFSQIGDMQLEANIEFRFPVYKILRGALFLDAGNIWLLKDSPDLPGGKFTFPGFLSQIALDFGIGIRLDFDFFIFRLDPAIPIRVPWYPADDRWNFNKMQLKDIVWNFGIGYPF